MDPFSRSFQILKNSTAVLNLPIEPTNESICYDSDESTTYVDLQPFVDSPNSSSSTGVVRVDLYLPYK